MPFSSPYSYAANNPVVLVDMDGLAPGGPGGTQNQPKQGSGKLPQPNGPQGEGQSGLPNPNADSPDFLNGTVWKDLSQSKVTGTEVKPQVGSNSITSLPAAKPGLAPFQPRPFPVQPNVPIDPPSPFVEPPGIETPGIGGLRWLVPGMLGTAALVIAFVLIPTGSSSTNNVVPQPGYYTDPFNPPTEPEPPTKEKPKEEQYVSIYKAPYAKDLGRVLARGYLPEDIAGDPYGVEYHPSGTNGRAYFAGPTSASLAFKYAGQGDYASGIVEFKIRKSWYDLNLKPLSRQYPGSQTEIEIPIPNYLLPELNMNTISRVFHPKF